MSAPSLPNFSRALDLSRGNLDSAEMAESHGLLCGLLCCGLADTAGDYLEQLRAIQLVPDASDGMAQTLAELWDTTRRQMEDEELGFALWLPDDDELLEERTISLAQWCSGFLAGLGSGCSLEDLTEEASEALEDLVEISRAEIAPDEGPLSASEEDEKAYAEIVEYVRIIALTLREEFRGPGGNDSIH
ncbi:MAG: UPF0149 family protein [Gammaproteobacteria bacterium]|nr:UPF0149 family protein [Gammaproteobacteria bacterium]